MPERVRIGVVGLGRRWERYRPALTATASPCEVRAVCDPSPRRAVRVAGALGCEAAGGLVELLENPQLEAALILDPAWYGSWPLDRALRAGKSVLYAPPQGGAENEADDFHQHVDEPRLVAMVPFVAAIAPAVLRLRALLEKHLGPPRVVSVDGTAARPLAGTRLLSSGALLPALYLCGELIGSPPESVWAAVPQHSGMVNLTFSFPKGVAARVTLTSGGGTGWRVRVSAANGTAEAILPRALRWRDAAGDHALRLPPYRGPDDLLRRFAESVRTGKPARPSLADARRAHSWLRAARRSYAEGSPVSIGPG